MHRTHGNLEWVVLRACKFTVLNISPLSSNFRKYSRRPQNTSSIKVTLFAFFYVEMYEN